MQRQNVSLVYDRSTVCAFDVGLDPNVEAVQEQLTERSKVGLQKYGVPTSKADLTRMQWLQHLQEELMDACVYIEALKKKETTIITGHVYPFDTVKPSALDKAYAEKYRESVKELVYNSETKKFEEYKQKRNTNATK